MKGKRRVEIEVEVHATITLENGSIEHGVYSMMGTAIAETEPYGQDLDGNRGVWTTFYDDFEVDENELQDLILEEFPDADSFEYTIEG